MALIFGVTQVIAFARLFAQLFVTRAAFALAFIAVEACALPLNGIDHFAVNVRDLNVAKSWYENVFGFGVLHEWSGVAMVGAGNIKIGLFEQHGAQPVTNPDGFLLIAHVAFAVDGDKFQDTLAQVRSKGITITEGPEDTGIAFVILHKGPRREPLGVHNLPRARGDPTEIALQASDAESTMTTFQAGDIAQVFIYPPIGIARVGDSEEYFLGPEFDPHSNAPYALQGPRGTHQKTRRQVSLVRVRR